MFRLPRDVRPRDVWNPPTWSASGKFQGCFVYQLFAAWWQLRSENLSNSDSSTNLVERGSKVSLDAETWIQGCGGFNCDEMGLGKTIEVFCTIALSNLILENVAEVEEDRIAGSGRHLSECESSLSGASCPSQESLAFECTCVRDSPTNKLQVRHGCNVIVMPVGVFGAYEEFYDLVLEPMVSKSHPWRLIRAHGSDVQPEATPYRWTDDDRTIYLPQSDGRPLQYPIIPPKSQDYLIIITTSRSLANRVLEDPQDLKFHIEPPEYLTDSLEKKRISRQPSIMGLKMSRLWRDEFHVEFRMNTKLMTTLKRLLEHQRTAFGWKSMFTTWFLSGTPFNTSPADMSAYINWMRSCVPSAKDTDPWQQHVLLSQYTEDAMKSHATRYKRYLELQRTGGLKHWQKRVKKPRCGTKTERARIQKAADKSNDFFSKLLSAFCIRRDSASYFNGYPIVQLPALTEIERPAPMSDLARETVEARIQSAASDGRPLPDRLKHIFANYPALVDIMPGSMHTVSEVARFYRTPSLSPYARHIDDIANSSGKLGMLKQILELELERSHYQQKPHERIERVVIGTIYPATSLIVYLVSKIMFSKWRYRPNAKPRQFLTKIMLFPEDEIALYHSGLDLEERGSLVKAFEDRASPSDSSDAAKGSPRTQTPTILIVQTTVGNAGINLQSASVMIKMEADSDYTRDAQMTKRIHRNGQVKKCRVYTLIEPGLAKDHNIDLRHRELCRTRGDAIENIIG